MRVVSFAVTLLCGACLYAQEYRGSIQGRVSDPSGAAVPAAAVAVKNVETGVSVDATTNEEGNCQVPFLLPGNYFVAVTHAGFKKAERNDALVNCNSRDELAFALEIGVASETVTVDTRSTTGTTESDLAVVMNNNVSNVAVYLSQRHQLRRWRGVSGAPPAYTSDNQTQISISGVAPRRQQRNHPGRGPRHLPLSSGSIVMVPSVDSIEGEGRHDVRRLLRPQRRRDQYCDPRGHEPAP